MQSRRDQVQAQSYVSGRLTSALTDGEPDPLEGPNRRTISGIIAGLLIGLLIVVGFLIYGIIVPGGSASWRAPGTLVVEKETGARYLLVDGRLRPVLNYASARLLLDRAPSVVTVASRSLRGVPHGPPIGIVGAPDSLPATSTLEGAMWTVCVRATVDLAGKVTAATTVDLGGATGVRALNGDAAFVVATSGDERYLVWRSVRFRLGRPWLSSVFGADSVFPAPAGWLDVLPAGPDVAPNPLPGRGGAGPSINGRPTAIGQVLVEHVAGARDRHFLVVGDGLASLTDLEYTVILADPDTASAYKGQPVAPIEVSTGAVATLPRSSHTELPAGLPGGVPILASPAGTWCAAQQAGGGRPIVTDAQPPTDGAPGTGLGVTRTARTAAVVRVGAGLGGLVRAGRPDQLPGSGYYLLTDAGLKFPVAGTAAARLLGYEPDDAVEVTQSLLDLLPTGPVLDRAAVTA